MTGRGERRPAVYIVASGRNGTIDVGVTSDLAKRASQHRTGEWPGFAGRHGCKTLVYLEMFDDMPAAIAREKQLKGGSRARKLALIEAGNPAWRELA